MSHAFILVIFPFINEMVEELHVTKYADRIGYVFPVPLKGFPMTKLKLLNSYYSGLVESIFAFVQLYVVFHIHCG